MARKDAEQNRDHILNVFEKLVRNTHLLPPTMSDVVRASGLGRGTVYRHFPDIGSLAFETLSNGYKSLFGNFRHDLTEFEGSGEQIDSSLIRFLEACQSYAQEHRILILTPECQSSKAYAKAKQSLRQLITKALTKCHGSGKEQKVLKIRADLIARCVEAEHLRDSGATPNQAHESLILAKEIVTLSETQESASR